MASRRGDEWSIKIFNCSQNFTLLNLFAKFKRVLACSCSSNFCVARKLAKQIFISARARTGSPSALCVGSGFRGHLVEFGRSILESLGYYLIPNKCKNLKDSWGRLWVSCVIHARAISGQIKRTGSLEGVGFP